MGTHAYSTCESTREGHMQKIQLRIAKTRPYARSLCATFLHDAVTESFLVFFPSGIVMYLPKITLIWTPDHPSELVPQKTCFTYSYDLFWKANHITRVLTIETPLLKTPD